MVTPVDMDLISIHAPRRGSDSLKTTVPALYVISIHAPRRGSDGLLLLLRPARFYFNPRSPQGERLSLPFFKLRTKSFQSTLPAGGATYASPFLFYFFTYFNPRSPQGERLLKRLRKALSYQFQSTLPAGGATS